MVIRTFSLIITMLIPPLSMVPSISMWVDPFGGIFQRDVGSRVREELAVEDGAQGDFDAFLPGRLFQFPLNGFRQRLVQPGLHFLIDLNRLNAPPFILREHQGMVQIPGVVPPHFLNGLIHGGLGDVFHLGAGDVQKLSSTRFSTEYKKGRERKKREKA